MSVGELPLFGRLRGPRLQLLGVRDPRLSPEGN